MRLQLPEGYIFMDVQIQRYDTPVHCIVTVYIVTYADKDNTKI